MAAAVRVVKAFCTNCIYVQRLFPVTALIARLCKGERRAFCEAGTEFLKYYLLARHASNG